MADDPIPDEKAAHKAAVKARRLAYSKAWYHANKARVKEYAAAYYQRTRDVQIERARKWQAANPEMARLISARSTKKNAQKYRDRANEYRRKNIEIVLIKDRARFQRDRVKRMAYTLQYFRDRPEMRRAICQNRRSKEMSAQGCHTGADILAIGNAQRWKCALCKVSVKKTYQIDHIQPLSKGGSNWPNNLQLLCKSCNCRKHNKDPLAFARQIGLLL